MERDQIFARAVGCLYYWKPIHVIGYNGTIDVNGITAGAIGSTLSDIGMPMVQSRMTAMIESHLNSSGTLPFQWCNRRTDKACI